MGQDEVMHESLTKEYMHGVIVLLEGCTKMLTTYIHTSLGIVAVITWLTSIGLVLGYAGVATS